MTTRPSAPPARPYFSSGPCRKADPVNAIYPKSYSLLGRSHRSDEGIQKLSRLTQTLKEALEIPSDYTLALLPGSATGATEAGFWNLLGKRHVELLVWDVFGKRWQGDIIDQLKLPTTQHEAPFGSIPDLTHVNFDHDVIFTVHGTSTGVYLPNFDWIPDHHSGLVFADATSAVFGRKLPWKKFDVTSFSLQKGLGAEGGLGVLVLSPKAYQHLEEHTPDWPIPYLLNLKTDGVIKKPVFEGFVLNTPSNLVIEDALECLEWYQSIGGLEAAHKRVEDNAQILFDWIEKSPWVEPSVLDPTIRSHLAVTFCLKGISDDATHWEKIIEIARFLEKENAAFDIKGHRLSTPHFRVWCGPTVHTQDVRALTEWLDYAYFSLNPSETRQQEKA